MFLMAAQSIVVVFALVLIVQRCAEVVDCVAVVLRLVLALVIGFAGVGVHRQGWNPCTP